VLQTRSCRFPLDLTALVLAGCAIIGGTAASACTIPVFRYALERWESDRFIVIVYHDGQLTAEQDSAASELTQRSSLAGGPLNVEVVRFDVTTPSPPKFPDLQPPPVDRPLPWVQILSRHRATHAALHWQGPLADAINLPGFYESPARKEIVRRILDGDAAVWLLVAPQEQLQQLSEQLQAKLGRVSQDQKLPGGIGLPGSELYASIPLEIRYSVLAVSHADPKEQAFLKQLGVSAQEWRADAAYVIPIFGRCRALDVIPYAEADEQLVEELATFLCEACSCRVKQANPGFDLLTSVNWDERLFGGSISELRVGNTQPSSATASASLLNSPEYLAIPTGSKMALAAPQTLAAEPADKSSTETGFGVASDVAASDAGTGVATTHQTPGSTINKLIVLVVIIALLGGGILAGVALTKH
jgi:hypothetical protein